MVNADTLRKRVLFIVAGALCLGCLSCAIVDFAINRTLTWSWIVFGGCALAMLAVYPALSTRRPILSALLGVSLGVIPYLWLIGWSLDDLSWFRMGAIIALLSIVYAFFAYYCAILAKWRPRFRSGALMVGAGVLNYSINTIANDGLPFWRILSFVILVAVGVMLMVSDKPEKA